MHSLENGKGCAHLQEPFPAILRPHQCCGLCVVAVCVQSGAAAAAGGEQEAADIARLARALVAAYERGGRAFALNRIVGGTNNWRLRAKMADDSFFSNAVDWSFGGPGEQAGVSVCPLIQLLACVVAWAQMVPLPPCHLWLHGALTNSCTARI